MATKKSDQELVGAGTRPFEEFIDKPEVGKRLAMRPRTIDDWMRRGLLPFYKVGRSVRFKWSEVEAHLEANCRVCHGGAER